MQPPSQQILTCPTCGAALEETPGGALGCMFCLLHAGIGSEEETVHDSTPDALEGAMRFGVYEIDCHADGSLCELGRGAMGVTYRATDTSLQRKVALKIIKTDIAERSADARERFIREARAAAALRHENIAVIHQFGMRLETGQYFYAMELIEGETLEERVYRAGPLDARTTIGIAEQVTSALAAAEKHGVVHRDLKPANLMLVNADDSAVAGSDQARSKRSRIRALRKSGIPVVKIIDFGLAKAFHSATDPKSLTHDRFVGTPAFASPEQFGHLTPDVRSDIYSLGATLWFALTGKTPFDGRTLSEIHRAQKSNALPLEQLKAAHVPHRLKSLTESMLAFEPASRPGTRELAARLQRCSPEVLSVRRTRVALASAIILILSATGFFAFRSLHTQSLGANPPIPEKSIAVLPFENRSEEKANAYFAEGIQDEILTRLSKIADLKVISRTSTQHYKSAPENLPDIARQLGVAHILEGSVQKSGNAVRVNVQLINAATDSHVWADTFDRKLTDLFLVESEVAKAIAEQLRARFSSDEKAAIESGSVRDLIAYELYREAKNIEDPIALDSKGQEHLLEAERLLKRALSRDPDLFPAQCLLARVEDEIYFFGIDRTQSRLAQAQSAIDAARQLQPDAGETHLALAQHLYWGYRDYDTARTELVTAARRLPNSSSILELVAYLDRRQGRWDSALKSFQRALELDPLNVALHQQIAMTNLYMRRFPEAAAALDHAVTIAPDNITTRVYRAAIDLWRNADMAPLRSILDAVLVKDPTDADQVIEHLFQLALMERNAQKAQQALTRIGPNGLGEDNFPVPYALCEAMVARLRRDSAAEVDALSRAQTELNRMVDRQPTYAEASSVSGLVKAALGDKQQAIAAGERAAELLPITKDARCGEMILENLALTYALVGEKDKAFAQLDRIMHVPGNINYGDFLLNPRWDPLRDDPRFEKLIAVFAPARD
jgi:serine/threonine protein kinase/lipopolysaccharide biosynthesis regulator YciM